MKKMFQHPIIQLKNLVMILF